MRSPALRRGHAESHASSRLAPLTRSHLCTIKPTLTDTFPVAYIPPAKITRAHRRRAVLPCLAKCLNGLPPSGARPHPRRRLRGKENGEMCKTKLGLHVLCAYCKRLKQESVQACIVWFVHEMSEHVHGRRFFSRNVEPCHGDRNRQNERYMDRFSSHRGDATPSGAWTPFGCCSQPRCGRLRAAYPRRSNVADPAGCLPCLESSP